MNAPFSTRRILSVWLRRLPTDRLTRRSAAPADQPLAIVAAIKSARRITAVNDATARLHLRVGMALADARAMYPSLVVADADPQADLALLEAVADWCDRYTPLIGLDAPDGLFLYITGCAHLFGGEEALCRDLWRRLSAQGFRVRMAIADYAGLAWANARYGQAGVIARGQARTALLPLPLAALRLDDETVSALAQSGLKYVHDIIDLPRAPLAARFGTVLLQRLDQALGREDESITPRLPLPSYLVEKRFAEPIAREEDVLGTIEHLSVSLARVMERHGEGARRLETALFRADGKVVRIAIGTGAPLRDPARIRRLFADRLAALADECDPGFGFDMVRLAALTSEKLDVAQTGFTDLDQTAELNHLIDRLSARFGAQRIIKLQPQDTHIPELAAAEIPAQRAGANPLPSHNIFSEQDSLSPARPLRLFERPEPIEVIASVPDGPPLRFRWRRVLHEVAQVEGPERIAMEWWRKNREDARTRDYFRIESSAGARLWLFREGLYERETLQPRWFLHGLFA